MTTERKCGFPIRNFLNELVIIALDPRVIESSETPEGKEFKEFKLHLTRLAVFANIFGDRKIRLSYT